jgi:hypothetical protein
VAEKVVPDERPFDLAEWLGEKVAVHSLDRQERTFGRLVRVGPAGIVLRADGGVEAFFPHHGYGTVRREIKRDPGK